MLAASICEVGADTWALPQKKKYYSPDKKYYLEVIPKELENQLKYFEDKVAGRQDPGGVKGLKDNRARAALYVANGSKGYSRQIEFPLVNEVSPVSAIVANSGKYFVTFDNWHSAGYGDNTVVIYRTDGTVLKKFSLEELLTKDDMWRLPRSASSIWWGGEHYVDEQNGLLVLKVVSNGMNPWAKEVTFYELKIELATGKPLEPKRDRLGG